MNIVFDMDDTMYDLMEPFRKAHEKYFAGRTCVACDSLFMQSRIYSDIILEQERQGKIPGREAFFQRIRMTYQDIGINVTKKEGNGFEEEYRYWQRKIQMFDFMRDILDYCRKESIPMAVLTNGNSKGQREKAAALKLNQWIEDDRIFVSGEIGYHKPDPRVFKAVEEYLGLFLEETWYVGDTYESDIEGAGKAGWHAIWLNHRRRPCPSAINLSEYELENGEELFDMIRYLNQNNFSRPR